MFIRLNSLVFIEEPKKMSRQSRSYTANGNVECVESAVKIKTKAEPYLSFCLLIPELCWELSYQILFQFMKLFNLQFRVNQVCLYLLQNKYGHVTGRVMQIVIGK